MLALEPFPDLAAARPAWERLAARSGNPFAAWEWAEAWYRHLGEGRPLRLLGARDPERGELVALLALAEDAPGAGTFRFMGEPQADELGPVCAPEHRPAALAALAGAVPGPARLLLRDLPPGSHAHTGGTLVRREACPEAVLPGSYDAFLAERSANFRSQARRRRRNLERVGRMEIRTADATSVAADIETLIRLHHARFGDASRVLRGPRGDLHREWAALAERRGELRLRILELDGVPVAANYALARGGREWFYQSGRDPAWQRFSPGFVLMNACIAAAIAEGATHYLLLRGDESYKARFATHDHGLETIELAVPAAAAVAA